MKDNLYIRQMKQDDAPVISSAFTEIGWNKPESLYLRYHREQEEEKRIVFVAFVNEEFAGYGNIDWESDYPPFREKQIPEIQDLNVLPKFRRRGIATAVMDKAEAMISERSNTVGIGVGLYSDYGAAQRMYVLRGYVPDGCGITYENKHVSGGQRVPVNDGLILWSTKHLK